MSFCFHISLHLFLAEYCISLFGFHELLFCKVVCFFSTLSQFHLTASGLSLAKCLLLLQRTNKNFLGNRKKRETSLFFVLPRSGSLMEVSIRKLFEGPRASFFKGTY